MKILQVSTGSVCAILLAILMVGSAGAAPLLNVGGSANYHLNASVQSSHDCNATPAAYNQTACGRYQPKVLVSIYDNGSCPQLNSSCYFSPAIFYYPISVGTTVMWFNYGSLVHTVTSISVPSAASIFNSGPMAHDASFFETFLVAGNYSYDDANYPSLRGSFIVTNAPPPTPVLSTINPTISLDGSIGWTIIGLDNTEAVLNVTHQTRIASTGPLSFTPLIESGSFSQSVDLATRIESSGTAMSLVLGLLQRMLSYYPAYSGYGYPSLVGTQLSQRSMYTFWWVNGPLADGQPVQVATGFASVTGSESINLGPGNNGNAWTVESEISESVSTTSPPVISPRGSSFSSFKLDLRYDYDESSDLLLKSSAVVVISSAQTQDYSPGDNLCGLSGCFPVSDYVTVDHHMSAGIPVTLQLTSTNFDLSKRMPAGLTGNGQTSPGGPSGTSGSSALPQSAITWIYVGIGVAGVAVIGTVAWLLRRRSVMAKRGIQPGILPPSGSPQLPIA